MPAPIDMSVPLPAPAPRSAALRLPLLAAVLAALLAPAAPALAQRAVLSHAERPAKLIRKTTVYDAPAGASLLPGDIIESGAGGIQIEWTNGALLALGPASSAQLDTAEGAPSVNLLRGWLKISANKPGATGLPGPGASLITTSVGALEVRASNASGILHLAADKTELFVEQGVLSASEKDRSPAGVPAPVNREQYAVRRGAQALQIMPRAPRLFVTEMPRTFFDPLVAVAGRTKPAGTVALREVEARDLADWNDAPALLRKRLVTQFSSRLADPAFRADAETVLANDADWRQVLLQNANNKRRANTFNNYLF
jgi:hypothetical protein